MTDWAAVIRKLAPHAKPSIARMVIDHADREFPKWGITTMRRKASILAHMCHETAGFTSLEENLNYSARRLREVWPNRFSAFNHNAAAVAHNPKAIANTVYNGRMGNRMGSDDGWIFRGHGLFQVTGRENTERLAKRLGVSAEMAAIWLTDPGHALACACAMFEILKMAPAADAENMEKQTRLINGGLNGLADRKKLFYIAMRALSAQAAPTRPDKFSVEPDRDAVLDQVSVADLRAAGSRTIAGADEVKSALTGVVTAGATASAVIDQTQNVVEQAQDVVEGVKSGASMIELLKDYWPVLLVIICLALTAYFVWRVWKGATVVTEARVDDARSGANIGR